MLYFITQLLLLFGLTSASVEYSSVKGRDYQGGQQQYISPGRIQQQDSIRQVHIIFRHGDRAPIGTYPKDPNNGYQWPFGRAQLTDVGKRQHYELGNFLRQRYGRLFSTDPREIEVRSSDKDRCLASAQANLASFFRPSGKWVWNNHLPWQPVPIHTQPGESDWLLNEDSKCPASDEIRKNIMKSPIGQKYAEKYRRLFELVTEASGKTVNDPSSVLSVYGITYINKLNNLTIPSWVDPMWEEFTRAADEAFVVANSDRGYLRLRAGPLIGHITTLMKKYDSEDHTQVLPKGYMYSTHDAMIAAFMNAIGVFNKRQVPYAATVLLELHEHQRPVNKYTVRMYYRNTSNHEAYPLVIPLCTFDCPLTDFEDLLREMVPINMQEECYGPSKATLTQAIHSSSSCCCCNQGPVVATSGSYVPKGEKLTQGHVDTKARMQDLLTEMRQVMEQHRLSVDRSIQELIREMDDVDRGMQHVRSGLKEDSDRLTQQATKRG